MTNNLNQQSAADTSSPQDACSRTRSRDYSILPELAVVLRLALGGLFLVAAYHKLAEPQLFSESVHAFHAFDFASKDTQGRLIQLATFMTPWIEVVAGLALVLGVWTRAAAAVLGALLVLFIGLIWSAMHRHLSLECGCFGKLSPFCPKKIGPCNIIQNSIMLAAVLTILLTPRHVLTLDSLINRKKRSGCRKG